MSKIPQNKSLFTTISVKSSLFDVAFNLVFLYKNWSKDLYKLLTYLLNPYDQLDRKRKNFKKYF
ncbi:hypothetical protein V6M85_02180 [Sulfolobus tengchongensis]|uniref:Transposase n=1 Tax=Sulfolobus tengchongensis TaxID=207809 RepID=A0AAX4L2T6_9CREN